MPLIGNKIILLSGRLLIHLNALENIKRNSYLLDLRDPFALIKFRFLLVKHRNL